MSHIRITAGPHCFVARLEEALAPRTCAVFHGLLPLRDSLIQARWSGEAAWVPMGQRELGLGFENATAHPAPGQILLYPGGVSETEILLPYGPASFASKAGQLAGNHFLTIVEGLEALPALGQLVLWQGAQEIRFEPLA